MHRMTHNGDMYKCLHKNRVLIPRAQPSPDTPVDLCPHTLPGLWGLNHPAVPPLSMLPQHFPRLAAQQLLQRLLAAPLHVKQTSAAGRALAAVSWRAASCCDGRVQGRAASTAEGV